MQQEPSGFMTRVHIHYDTSENLGSTAFHEVKFDLWSEVSMRCISFSLTIG